MTNTPGYPAAGELLEQKLARAQGAAHGFDRIPRPSAAARFGGMRFWTVEALGRFWPPDPADLPLRVLTDRCRGMWAGWAASGRDLVFIVAGVGGKLNVVLGEPPAEDHLAPALVASQFPAARLKPRDGAALLTFLDRLPLCHLIAGAPFYPKPDQADRRLEQIDQLARGLLYDGDFALVVAARPLPYAQADEFLRLWAARISLDRARHQVADSVDAQDRSAGLLLDQMEEELERARVGRSQGMWLTEMFLWSASPAAAAVTIAALAGEDSRPDPLRAYPTVARLGVSAGSSDPMPAPAITALNSRDLAQVAQFPLQEYPGCAVETAIRLDVVPPALPADARRLEFLWISDLGASTGEPFPVDADRLTGHALIVGATDSGKTNTCFLLLEKLHAAGIPFLVIEPAKGEYRFLKAAFPDLRVFTLGANEAPLRINPFYVPPGVSAQSHIDALLSLFSAAFVLYTPMPYVLERALHEAYEAKGWELATNLCRRGDSASPRAFPTLTDLYHRIDAVVERTGFDARLAADVRASLQARVNSLRIGAKGAMLDGHAATTLGEIMQGPAVVELGQIGNDEQKAFLMGLLLVMLGEHYAGAGLQVDAVRLRHVTVIEEAHRLLENVATDQGGDFANPRGKAVQSFANLISEIRAYGEGFVIVDQSPTKLAPDAIRNTNLKLAHRLVAEEDRAAIARAVNLRDGEQEALVTLPRGRALAFSGGMDRPIFVAAAPAKGRLTASPRPAPASALAAAPTAPTLRLTTWAPREEPQQAAFLRWALAAAYGDAAAQSAGAERVQAGARAAAPVALRTERMARDLERQVVSDLARWFSVEFGGLYNWPFDDEAACEADLRAAWESERPAPRVAQLLAAGAAVARAPYRGCSACDAPCRYRLFAATALRDESTADVTYAMDQYARQPDAAALGRLGLALRAAAERVAPPTNKQWAHGAALCVLITLAERAGWPAAATRSAALELRGWLDGAANKERA